MPSKVYVEAPPDGDFRAMPARGGGYAVAQVGHVLPAEPGARPPDGQRHRPALGRRRRAPARAARRRRAHGAANRRRRRAGRRDARRRTAGPRPWSAAASTAARSRGRSSPAGGASCCGTSTPQRAAEVAAELGAGATGSRERGARRGRRRHGHARTRDPLPARKPPLRAAREPHGRRRARKGRDRGRGAPALAGRRRRVGAGEPQRRHRARRRGGPIGARGRRRARAHPPRRAPGRASAPTRSPSSTRPASPSRTSPWRRSCTSATGTKPDAPATSAGEVEISSPSRCPPAAHRAAPGARGQSSRRRVRPGAAGGGRRRQ